MATLAEMRAQYPQYQDMSDRALADALHGKFYSDIPKADFYSQVGLDERAKSTPAEAAPEPQSGFFRGLKDPQQGITQLVGKAVEAVVPSDSRFGQAVARTNESLRQMFRGDEAEYQAARPADAGIDWARIGGNVAMTAPMAMVAPAATTLPGAVGIGLASGGVSGAMQPALDENFWTEKAIQAGTGALTGGAAGGALHAVGRIAAPQTNKLVQKLMDEGVTPTPGQIMGGTAKSIEDKARALPFVGDKINQAQGRAVDQFNRAAINRVLSPIGQALPDHIQTGQDALRFAKEAVSSSYDDTLDKIKLVGVDQQFGDDLNNLRSLAQNMVAERAKQFDAILNNEVLRRFDNGQISGETMKKIESELGKMAGKLQSGGNQDASLVGDAVQELQASLRSLVMRTNPDAAASLRATNEAFANLARVQRAGGAQGAEGGVFTPKQLSAAVRQGDQSARKNAYGMGDALMQDLSDAGRAVLSNGPDSGTAARMMPWMGGGGLGYLAYADPITTALATGATAGAASLPYTQLGGRLAAALLAGQRPSSVQVIGNSLKTAAPYAAAGSPAFNRSR